MTDWLNEPTEDGYWLILDRWLGVPEVVILKGFGTLNPIVERVRPKVRLSSPGFLKNARWSGPIQLPEEQ